MSPKPRSDLLGWRVRAAGSTAGLVAVLVGLSLLAVWSSWSTSAMAGTASTTAQLSAAYTWAERAVATEASLTDRYRLAPRSDTRAAWDGAAASLEAAMRAVQRTGDAEDRQVAAQVLTSHEPYVAAVVRLFAAVNRDDPAEAARINRDEVEPVYRTIDRIVHLGAQEHHQMAVSALTQLQHRETLVSRTTPVVFAAGLVLVLLFASVLRRVLRLLDAERGRVEHHSLHDALTGLPNRNLLIDRTSQALAARRRDGTDCALLLLDLDRFKEVNDALGHACGDALLAEVAARLRHTVREVDTVARLGGDEFVVLLPAVAGVGGAVELAGRLREAVADPYHIEGLALEAEASVGVVVAGVHGDDPATLLQRAEVAMYLAKSGSLGVAEYDPAADEHSPQRLVLLGELRHALDADELCLHFQPKVSISSGQACGVEALVRWRHPTRGMVPPDKFIPLAEHTGLIGPMTERVLDQALARSRDWLRDGLRIPVAVNVSARNLVDTRLPGLVDEALRRHGLPPEMLLLEVTESAIMTEPDRARRLLHQLHELGVRIAVDDFGVGYTSLAQLKTLPLSELKVDRSFVSTVDTDVRNAMIVQSVVDLGHNLGLTVVAEGVETTEVLDRLRSFGCDVAQGYLLSRPLPTDDVARWYRDFHARVAAAPAGTAPAE